MRIPYKTKLLMSMGIFVVVFITGCVDTSVQSIPSSIDYSSQIKIVNLVSGAGTATVTLNGQSLGTVDFGSEIPGSQVAFLTIPAGNKTLNAVFATDTSDYLFAAATDYKLRVFLVGTSASNELFTQYQRYIWQTPGSANGSALFPADTGQVAFFNGSPDAVINGVTIGDTSITFDSPLAMGDGTSYHKLKTGSFAVDVLYNDSLHVTFNYTLESKGRYTVAIYDAAASIKNAVFVDD
jgi:hypothetical protein